MTVSGKDRDTLDVGAGERVLEVLVNYEKDGLYSGSTWIGDIVRKISWATDGRSVRPALTRLERAGLIEQDRSALSQTSWRPTARGREVDGLLRQITARRGGTFRPRVDVGIDIIESAALQ